MRAFLPRATSVASSSTAVCIHAVTIRPFHEYAGDEGMQKQFVRKRKQTSYTSKEKEKAVEFWEKTILRKLPSQSELERFRHYTMMEEAERLEDDERRKRFVQQRNETRMRNKHDVVGAEKPLEAMNLNPEVAKHYPHGAGGSSDALSADAADDALRCEIVSKLVKAERRIYFGADFGSLGVMRHLNDAAILLSEAEELLNSKQWMTDDVAARILELRQHADKVKFDLDID